MKLLSVSETASGAHITPDGLMDMRHGLGKLGQDFGVGFRFRASGAHITPD